MDGCVSSGARSRHRAVALAACSVAAGAWLGAYGLISGWLSLAEVEHRLPLGSPVLGGMALAVWVALPFSMLALKAWRGDRGSGPLALAVGALLLLWLAVQLAFIRTVSLFHPIYALIGLGFVLAGRRICRRLEPEVDEGAVQRFLSSGRLVVVGATDDPQKFGSTVVRSLIDHGHSVVPVNPARSTVAGISCAPNLYRVHGAIEAVLVLVPGDAAIDAVRACVELHVPKVWLFRGAGPGAVSPDALALCRANGIEVVAGACPLMFLSPVVGVHKAHLAVRRLTHAVG